MIPRISLLIGSFSKTVCLEFAPEKSSEESPCMGRAQS